MRRWILLVVAAWPLPALGQTKAECLAAFERGQDLERELKLSQARDQFLLCAREACTALVRKDCTEAAEAVLRSQPSFVLRAQTSRGEEIPSVSWLLDGKPVTAVTGAAIAVDPGSHTLRGEKAPYSAVSQTIVFSVGERHRPVIFTFRGPDDRTPAPNSGPVAKSPADWGAWPYVTGIAGTLALGAFAYFALQGSGERQRLEDSCAPYCSRDETSTLRTSYLAADVSLGVAIVAAVATGFFLLIPRSKGDPRPGPSAYLPVRSF